MTSENFHYQNNDVQVRLSLLHEAEAGHLDELTCPQCGSSAVGVRFTQPTTDEYRTWFVCSNCDFEMRVQNSDKPKYFGEGHFDPELQARDEQIVSQRKFPPPG